jgi:hypothetical protein
MKAVIRNYDEAIKFVHRILDTHGEHFAKPQLISCEIYRAPRSLPQNAKLHAMIGELAKEVGYAPSELKDWFKVEFGPKKRFEYRGIVKMIPKSTAEYSKLQMIDFIDQIYRVAAEMGYTFSEDYR